MKKNAFSSVSFQEKKDETWGGAVFPLINYTESQILSFTLKINKMSSHLKWHRKDYSSQRGLKKLLGKRQRLLSYVSKKNDVRCKILMRELKIK